MIVTVTIETDEGPHSYTGHIVCRGPGTMDMLLTHPFPLAGRSVQFPVARVLSVTPESRERKEAPVPG